MEYHKKCIYDNLEFITNSHNRLRCYRKHYIICPFCGQITKLNREIIKKNKNYLKYLKIKKLNNEEVVFEVLDPIEDENIY